MTRRKRPEEHDNHERWLVSYADFITLLFAFFVVMYSISVVNESKYKTLSDVMTHAFRNNSSGPTLLETQHKVGSQVVENPTKPTQPKPDGKAEQQLKLRGIAQDITQVLDPLVKGGQVRISQTSRGVAVEINASVLFGSGNAELAAESSKALTAVAQVLKLTQNVILVEGYTDNAPIKSPHYPSNWELSSARASRVVRLFIDHGVSPTQLVAVGYAENRPLANNDNAENKAKNRRVNIMILAQGQEHFLTTEVDRIKPTAPTH